MWCVFLCFKLRAWCVVSKITDSDRSVKQQQKASFWDDILLKSLWLRQCMVGSVVVAERILTCLAGTWQLKFNIATHMQHQCNVHSILMHDTRLKECTLLYMSLLEVKGTSGQLSYFHQSPFDKHLQRVMEEHSLPLWTVTRCCRELIGERERLMGEDCQVGKQERALWQLKNYNFIHSMHYLYQTHILS